MAKTSAKKTMYSELDKQRAYQALKGISHKDPLYRTDYRKDYGRLIHSAAFRRLQGKTQLFPSSESDFSRNRLTHSLEVAQIAKSIALKINHEYLPKNKWIDLDIVEFAGLAHDLGHPPFGHNGELALDECMRTKDGGFEGNAQTLRILTRLEKKVTSIEPETNEIIYVTDKKKDARFGLNLTARTLASILKYDYKIPQKNSERIRRFKNKVAKGYYNTEHTLVENVKKSVLGTGVTPKGLKFKTIECQIMDIADDIAYSTYDLEDAFKAEFLDPLKLISMPNDKFYIELAADVKKKLDEEYSDHSLRQRKFTQIDVYLLIVRMFRSIFNVPDDLPTFEIAGRIAQFSKQAATSGYERTAFTSSLVNTYVESITFELNENFPALSTVRLDIETFKMIETMKKFAYKALIMSPMLKLAEYRGKDIVKKLFNTLTDDKNEGFMLLPNDFRNLYSAFGGSRTQQKRVVCDFIAGMTDQYAMNFYNRIFGTSPETIHKPL